MSERDEDSCVEFLDFPSRSLTGLEPVLLPFLSVPLDSETKVVDQDRQPVNHVGVVGGEGPLHRVTKEVLHSDSVPLRLYRWRVDVLCRLESVVGQVDNIPEEKE